MKQPKNNLHILIFTSVVHAHYWYVARLPHPHEHLSATQYSNEIGGKGFNILCALHRLNCHLYPIFALGKDHTAQLCQDFLASKNIATDYVFTFDDTPSGSGAAFIDHVGHNMLAIHLGANLKLTAQHITQIWQTLPPLDLIYAQFENAIDAIEQSFLSAPLTSHKVLNPSPWQQPTTIIQNHTTLLILNEIEFCQLIQHTLDFEISQWKNHIAQLFIQIKNIFKDWQNLQILVITFGQYGACATQKTPQNFDIWSIDAIEVNAVDSTGCGDAFAATFCYMLLQHDSISYALQQATLAAAWMASQHGVSENLLSSTQLQDLNTVFLPPVAIFIDPNSFIEI